MTEGLSLCGVREGLAIANCLPKVEFFCEHDAYQDYDRTGYQYACDPDHLSAELLKATNRAMKARARCEPWAQFFRGGLPELAEVSVHADLVDSDDAGYATARAGLGKCYRKLTAAKWITDMAATKMLHLKRPRLVAISDSYVREILAIREPEARVYPWRVDYCTERALRVSDAARAVGRRNAELLDGMQMAMAPTVERISAKCQTPMSLSRARIIDILLWVDAAIGSGHKTWSPVAAAAGWYSVLDGIRASTG